MNWKSLFLNILSIIIGLLVCDYVIYHETIKIKDLEMAGVMIITIIIVHILRFFNNKAK